MRKPSDPTAPWPAEAVEVPQQTVADWEKEFTEICAGHNSVNSSSFTPGGALRSPLDFAPG